ncbi:chromate transporter [Liberiplasma polymorphum]|uniref:chromate transporter n=1 Tax=Liberiplasma polymorphum TaxID=3374570 RepID=UPI003770E442
MMIIINLFIAFLTIGMVSFGGGYAMLPLFERLIVVENAWIDMDRFVDMIAISQMTPGPIAINSATFIGYQVGGIVGAVASTVGVVFIPVALVLMVSKYYEKFKRSKVVKAIFKGLRPALVGLIAASVYSVAYNSMTDWQGVILVVIILFLLTKLKLHPILVIFISGILGIIVY